MGSLIRDDGNVPEFLPVNYGTMALAGGTVSTTLFDAGADGLGIKAVGTELSGRRRAVEVLLDIDNTNKAVGQFATLSCGNTHLTGSDDTLIDGSTRISGGDVYASGNLKIEGASAVQDGNVYAGGNIQFSGYGSVSGAAVSRNGNIESSSGPYQIRADSVANPLGKSTLTPSNVGQGAAGISHDPAIWNIPEYCKGSYFDEYVKVSDQDFADYRSRAQAGGSYTGNVVSNSSHMGIYTGQHYINGNMTINATPADFAFDGLYFIEGNLEIKGNFSGNATFVVMGNVHFNGTADVSATDSVNHAFVSRGNIHMSGNTVANGVMYANGNVHSEGNATVNGSVISSGGNLHTTGSFEVNYIPPDRSIELPKPYFNGFEILRWRRVSP